MIAALRKIREVRGGVLLAISIVFLMARKEKVSGLREKGCLRAVCVYLSIVQTE